MSQDAVKNRSLNVVLFGETGSGKSSVINLLTGKEIAQTSPDIEGCTKTCQPYPLVVHGVSYTIWDTIGLDEPMIGDSGYLHAIEQVCKLVRDLVKEGGVDLLLLCHRQGRISTITQRIYVLLHEVACQQAVPVAVVITYLEQKERMEDWWDQNADVFEQRGLKFCGHACVTTLSDDPRMQRSREAIEGILENLDLSNRGCRTPAKLKVQKRDLVRILQVRCGIREQDAPGIAKILTE